MSKIDDGGPAFPTHLSDEFIRTPDGGWGRAAEYGWESKPGMSLRVRIALEVLASLVQKAPLLDREGEHGPKFTQADLWTFRMDMARSALDYADAMILTLRSDAEIAKATGNGGVQ